MKKFVAMMLAGAMLLTATGCARSGNSTEDAVAQYGSGHPEALQLGPIYG